MPFRRFKHEVLKKIKHFWMLDLSNICSVPNKTEHAISILLNAARKLNTAHISFKH